MKRDGDGEAVPRQHCLIDSALTNFNVKVELL